MGRSRDPGVDLPEAMRCVEEAGLRTAPLAELLTPDSNTALCAAVGGGCVAAASALVSAGADLVGSVNMLYDMAAQRGSQGLEEQVFVSLVDALLSCGLPPPGPEDKIDRDLLRTFPSVHGAWARGMAWDSMMRGPGRAVEEAHWAAAMLAWPSLHVTDGPHDGDCYYQAPPLPRHADTALAGFLSEGALQRRPCRPYRLQRVLQLHTPGGPWECVAEQVLFVLVDFRHEERGMPMEEWAEWADVNPALPLTICWPCCARG